MTTDAEKLLRSAVADVTAGKTLTTETMTSVVDHLMESDLSERTLGLLAASLICSLKTRGETLDEVVGAARSLRRHQIDVSASSPDGIVVDTCGTGGDGAHLINISTITGLVAASLGVTVAKHGNRSVSSSCGSADLLEEMGYPLLSDHQLVSRCLAESGFGFLFAPHFHPALKSLSGLRRELGVRTVFNMLGPLVNPAGATHQLIGVFDQKIVRLVAEAAGTLGVKRCLVVHGEGGLDELSPSGKSWVSLCDQGEVQEFEWTPASFGAEPVALEALRGGDAAFNHARCQQLFNGKEPDLAGAVAMNCAAVLWLVGRSQTLKEGYGESYQALQSGAVRTFFENAREAALSVAATPPD